MTTLASVNPYSKALLVNSYKISFIKIVSSPLKRTEHTLKKSKHQILKHRIQQSNTLNVTSVPGPESIAFIIPLVRAYSRLT